MGRQVNFREFRLRASGLKVRRGGDPFLTLLGLYWCYIGVIIGIYNCCIGIMPNTVQTTIYESCQTKLETHPTSQCRKPEPAKGALVVSNLILRFVGGTVYHGSRRDLEP